MRTFLLCVVVGSVVACAPRPDVVEADLAIVGVDVIPMTSDTVIRGQSVFVRDGVIVRVADSASVRPGSSAQVVDGHGRFVFPGLVDAHAHIRAEKVLDLFLSYGFTTVRNMHGALGDPLTWAREIESGRRRGPTLINASPILRWDSEGQALPGPGPIQSFEDVRGAVEAARDSGYAVIKVVEFPQEAFDSLVSVANALGLPVAGHLPITSTGDPDVDLTLDEALESGLAVVEHLGELIDNDVDPASRDSVSAESLARRVAASGVAVTTITDLTRLMASGLRPDAAFPSDSLRAHALRYGGPEEAEMLDRMTDIWRQFEFVPIEPSYLSLVIRRLHEAGVPLMIGTDAHSALQVAGLSAIQDMLFLVQTGLTPYHALAAMTAVPPRVFGQEGRWGTVVEGGRADALLLSGNPLDDPSVLLTALEGMLLQGAWLDGSQLDAMRADAESRILACREVRCDT